MGKREAILRKLTDSGEIHEYFKAGIVSPSMIRNMNIYYDVLKYETLGNERLVSIQQVADLYRVSVKTVYRAINWMKE